METRYIFESQRLGFRCWKEADQASFTALTADSEVMRYFPKPLEKSEAIRLISRFEQHMNEKGYTMWAVERKEDGVFIGFIGLLEITMAIEGQGHAEIGWRLDSRFWKQGYATEGARACLAYAFGPLNMAKVYSFTSAINLPSESVMKKIGMIKVSEFEHPDLEKNSPLKRHVLYKIHRPEVSKNR